MAASSKTTSTFEPSSDLIQEDECDTLLLYVPGFKKEQLRVQLSKTGLLKISGIIWEDKWISFQKEFQVSPNCDKSKISAKFEDGVLYIRQPKLIVPAKKEEITLPLQEASQPQKTTEGEKPTKNDQEQINNQKTENVDQTKQNFSKELPEKSVQEELKSTNKEETSSKNDDQGGASRTSSNEHKNVPENANFEFGAIQNGKTKVDGDNKLTDGSPVAKLKKARKMMNVVLVVLVVFGIGMFVSNSIWRYMNQHVNNGFVTAE